ncbi:HlyD family efflux transporter periplasmic adaptor subunit [Pseudoalteromonas flavipulchra]|uniref:HlyD family efflux transporter periplasmic adaptor subunit n=1 Tax=Pseudoalteromonas maricaloris TaxID=184924 RepID=A0A8I2HB99_9GAMM|nr:HlyD family efflux transporter periplasmic adaptor subunit [Pseudoalteromonas flavipulchra]MBE0371157.1 hypothetical protein [Pseudoalteromonas flavipulchra NCIMB 2033 = ATCC BAA-314]NLR24354.1 HlyD family efflux transporter periplasmic adaptor subunit [Pseudoalteromonas maricaloris]RZG18144.1 HlyD family efflux transporter periplasmic adaptor subunit [Pseudoalteromonas sp. CO342X]
MQVLVGGYGVLRSKKQTLITSQTPATVKEIYLRPGAKVEPDSVIMQLNNPEALKNLEAARIALAKEKANLRRLKLSNRQKLLAEKSKLAELSSEYEVAKLKKIAEQKLVQNGIVSSITYQTTVLNVEQMKLRVNLLEEALEQYKAVNQEVENIQQEAINEYANLYRSAAEQVEQLTVKAGLAGILQRMPVELGQSVTAGQELALVGSKDDLLAMIKVSQSNADQLQIGQQVSVKSIQDKMAGKISRIAPQVNEGTIEVEITFDAPAPPSARPELSVDAEIVITTLRDTLFIERPINAQKGSQMELFKLDPENEWAEKKLISFGNESGNQIEVYGGAVENDRLILSNLTNFKDADRIHILN